MANNKIYIKRTSTSGNKPTTGQIANGELAVNMTDGILYSTNGSVVFEIGANVTSKMIGNTTANITGNTTMLRIANSTTSANLTPLTLTIGTSVVNSTVIATGANVFMNTTAIDAGNSVMTSVLLTLGGQVNANGGVGSAGQVLTSGGAANVYWATPTVGDITGVTAGNGLTGGGTSGDVTLNVGAANGITVAADTVGVTQGTGLVVNATGVHVNALYINTISSNSATYANASITNTFTVGTASYFVSNGNLGVGTSAPGYRLEVNGSFAATTKSFVIDHPTKQDMKLRYGSLEGPENGVYVRGRSNTNKIELPDYWVGLIDENSVSVNITAIGKKQELYVKAISNNIVTIGGARTLDFFYTVFAERKDVEKLVVEF